MPVPSTLFYAATIVSTAISGSVLPFETSQAGLVGSTVRLEKLYSRGDKVIDTPMMNVVEANERCPNGYALRREGREDRGGDVFLTWTLNCN